MKLVTLVVVVGCQAFASAAQAVCQQTQSLQDRPYLRHTESPRLHFSVPSTRSTGRVELAASNAQRNLTGPLDLSSAEIDSVLQLRGRVDVLMCSPGNHGCANGAMQIHADVVDYNEKTQEIHARGDVRIKPFRSVPQDSVIPR